MPIEEQLPPTLLEQICDYCRQMNLPLLVACDSNAHHPFWGCADFNNRGKALSEYLATSGLEVANVGNERGNERYFLYWQRQIYNRFDSCQPVPTS